MSLARRLGVREASDQMQVLTSTLNNWVKLVSRPVQCTLCGYTTYTASTLVQHERNMHGSEGRLHCQLCEVRPKNKNSLRKHMRRGHDKISDRTSDKILDRTSDKTSDKTLDKTSDEISDKTSEKASNKVSLDKAQVVEPKTFSLGPHTSITLQKD